MSGPSSSRVPQGAFPQGTAALSPRPPPDVPSSLRLQLAPAAAPGNYSVIVPPQSSSPRPPPTIDSTAPATSTQHPFRPHSPSTSINEVPTSPSRSKPKRASLSARAFRAFSLQRGGDHPPKMPPPTVVVDLTGGVQISGRKEAPAGSAPPPVPTSVPLCEQPSPFTTSSYFSILFLHLMNPLLVLGRKRPLTLQDIWESTPSDRTEVVHRQLEAEWEAEVQAARVRQSTARGAKVQGPSLFRALRRAFGWRMYVMLMLEVLYYCFYATIPFSMRALVAYIYNPTAQCSYLGVDCSWVYSTSLGAAVFLASVCINHKFYHAYRVGGQMRSALMTTVYAKALRLSSASRANSTSGETVNLMSNDCSRVFDAVLFFNTLLVAPTVIVVALVLLILEIGIAAVAAVGLMLVVIPYQVWTARKTSGYRKTMLRSTDQRVKFISEILQGIRICKMMAWEEPMGRTIAAMRAAELSCLRSALLLKAVNLGVLFVYPVCVTFVTFVVYAYLGGSVVPSNVFIVMSFLTLIRFPVSLMPQAITFVSEAKVGLERIQAFLTQEELQSIQRAKERHDVALSVTGNTVLPVTVPLPSTTPLPPGSIVIERGTFRWSRDNAVPILSGIDLHIRPGELIGVIGSVGCGKSSLLAAVLGEMEMAEDSRVQVEGKVGYLSQKPWIRNQTMKENIVAFGPPYDAARYQRCIKAAALLADFAILPAGDQTEIGEQGLNLSGGQKARVSLARALYRAESTDIYAMDDILSAVDMNVGRVMFEEAVMGVLGAKTRILVLNSHLHFLQRCDRILVVERLEAATADHPAGGRIAATGSYKDIAARYPHLLSALESTQDAGEEGEEAHVIFDPKTRPLGIVKEKNGRGRSRPSEVVPFHAKQSISSLAPSITAELDKSDASNDSPRSADEADEAKDTTDPLPPVKPPAPSTTPAVSGALISIERTGEGEIALSVYVKYFQAASVRFGLLVLVLILASYVCGQVTRIMSDYWLVEWGSDNNSPPAAHPTEYWVLTWAGWIVGAFTFALSRAYYFTHTNIRASSALHNRVFARLMRAPTNLFFDITPAGRVVNLMSKDLEQVDTLLPGYLHEFVLYAFQFAGSIILACVVTVYFVPIIVPIVVFFLWIQTFFRTTSRELKRLEGKTRSPIFSSFGETLQGLQSIRAYGLSEEFIRENERRVDVNSRVFLTGYLTERWLSIRLEVCSFLVVFAVALLTSNLRGAINPTLAGLTLMYALQMTGILQWTVRLSIQTENTMTAVERLNAFDELPQEAAYDIPDAVPAQWPHAGAITFTEAKLRYRPELDLVMRGITASIQPGEKVGICGRTGSGKSTLMVALFRLVELTSGAIHIDGCDISKVGLHRLRSSLSIIPQDAVLFSGSVRYNLDPFHDCEDAAVWQALDRVGLSAPVKAMPGGLDAPVAEGGDNFSHGQKQLICIARALLRQTRILILDEATASIDPASDRALQETLATAFAHCTVLTIAHRLSTICHYDRVMVLKDGEIAELDRPSTLLRRRSGLFYSMVSEGGQSLLDEFTKIADAADEVREKKKGVQGMNAVAATVTTLQRLSRVKVRGKVERIIDEDDDNRPSPAPVRVQRVRGQSIMAQEFFSL